MTNIIAFPLHRARRSLMDRAEVSEAELAETRRMLTRLAATGTDAGAETGAPAPRHGGKVVRLDRRRGRTATAAPQTRLLHRCCNTAVAIAEDTVAVAERGEPARAALDLHARPNYCEMRPAPVIDLATWRKARRMG